MFDVWAHGPWFASIGLTEVDRTRLLLLLLCWCCWLLLLLAVVKVEVVVGCRTSRGARAGICSAFASNPVCQHDVFQFEMTPCFVVCRLFFIRHVQFL